jgi:hypothetical protein
MRGYAETDVFSEHELDLLVRAREVVAVLPSESFGEPVRCHELAHAVAWVLSPSFELEVADGWYGMIQHSWLWTQKLERVDGKALGPFPNILDVYVPGRLPQVQLVHVSTALPFEYRRGDPRDDIRKDVIEHLVRLTKERSEADKPSLTISGPPWHTTFSPGRTL